MQTYPKIPQPPYASALPDIRVLEAQQNLVEQLGRAMTQGLIQPAIPAKPRRSKSGHPTPTATSAPNTPSGNLTLDKASKHLNLDAVSAFDRDSRERKKDQINPVIKNSCLKDREVDLETWYGDMASPNEMASLRRSLLGEFDQPNKQILEKLVKFYIVEGFGTEAKDLLKSYPGLLPQTQVLSELAELLETGKVPEGTALTSQIRCPGDSAMWGLLARGSIPVNKKPNEDRIAKQIAQMRPDLRRRVGALLMSILLDAKYPDFAQRIALIISRSSGDPGAGFRLQNARLDLVRGANQKAIDTLYNLARSDKASAGKALLLLMQTLTQQKATIANALLNDVAARAFVLRYSDLGQRLRRIEIQSRADLQHQYLAFEILAHELQLGALSPKIAGEIAANIFISFNLAQIKGDEIVKTFFRYKKFLTEKPSMDIARQHMAKGLALAGLPSVAMQILAPLIPRMTSQDRVLAADILSKMGQPSAALAELGTLSSTAANVMRQKIFVKTRKYNEATAASISETSNPQLQDLAWRAGRWDSIEKDGRTSRKNAALYAEKTVNQSAKSTGRRKKPASVSEPTSVLLPPKKITFSSLEATLLASKKSRMEIDALLKDHPPP